MKRISRLLIGLCVLTLISSCGWHLRGNQNIDNVSAVHVSAKNANSGLAATLKRAIKARGIEIVSHATDASHSIVILDQSEKRRTLSVAGSGKASEFLLTQKVEFIILDRDGNPLAEKQTATTERSYDHNENRPLAKSTEENLLRKEMQQGLAESIIRALGSSNH